MEKVYTIEITGCALTPLIWYCDKIGKEYEAELAIRIFAISPINCVLAFKVSDLLFVNPIDCRVVGERTVELYKKNNLAKA